MVSYFTRKQYLVVVATLVALVAVVAFFWFQDMRARGAAGEYTVTVVRAGEQIGRYNLEQMRALGTRRVWMEGKLEEGPTLLGVLRASGVTSFESVTVRGMGLRDSGVIELARSQIDDDVLLDIAVRGTTKLCGPNIAWADRVRDVELIEVR
jgi:hypothetical protein